MFETNQMEIITTDFFGTTKEVLASSNRLVHPMQVLTLLGRINNYRV